MLSLYMNTGKYLDGDSPALGARSAAVYDSVHRDLLHSFLFDFFLGTKVLRGATDRQIHPQSWRHGIYSAWRADSSLQRSLEKNSSREEPEKHYF